MGIAHDRHWGGRTSDIVAVALWSLIFALVAWRVWRGGRTAIRLMARLGTLIGDVFLAGMAAFAVLFLDDPPGGSVAGFLPYLLPGLAFGATLLTAGVLLRRREISRWSGF